MSDFDEEDESDFWDDEDDEEEEEDDGYFGGAGLPFVGAGFGDGPMFGMGTNFFGFCSRCKKNFAPDEFKAHVKICRAKAAQSWACDQCTLNNPPHTHVCVACGAKKPEQKAAASSSSSNAKKEVIMIDDDEAPVAAAAAATASASAASSSSSSSSSAPAAPTAAASSSPPVLPPSSPSASPPTVPISDAAGPGAGGVVGNGVGVGAVGDDEDVVMIQAYTPARNGKREAVIDDDKTLEPVANSRLLICSICRLHNTFDSVLMLSSCGHAVCVRCLNNHVITRPPVNSETCPRKHCTARLMPIEVHSVVKPSSSEEYWSSTYQAVLRKVVVSWLPSAYTTTWPGVQCACGRKVALPDPSVVEWNMLRHCSVSAIDKLVREETRPKCLCGATTCIGCGRSHSKSDEPCPSAKLQILGWLLGALGVMLQDLTGKEGGFDPKIAPVSRRPDPINPPAPAPSVSASSGKKRKSEASSSSSSAAASSESAAKNQKTTRGRTRSSSKKAASIPEPSSSSLPPPVVAVPAAGVAVGFFAGLPILSMGPVQPIALPGAIVPVPSSAVGLPALPMVAPLPPSTPVKAKAHSSLPSPPPPSIPKGVGYDGAPDDKNYKASMHAKQRQQDSQDGQVDILLRFVLNMLRDHSFLSEQGLDAFALLRRSPLTSLLSVYLRNDSIQEQLRRGDVFASVYSICRLLLSSDHFLPIACPEVTEDAKVAESLGSLTKPLTTLHKMASLHLGKAAALADSSDAESVRTLELMESIQDLAELSFTHVARLSHILETRHQAIDKEPPPQPEEESKDSSVTVAAVEGYLRASRFQMGDILTTKTAHVFSSAKGAAEFSGPKTRLSRIRREITSLCSDLPDGIYVVADSSNLDFLRAMIVGPKDTPYENGLFCFDIHLPGDYPNKPPHVKFVTTNFGTFRFNPNLYSNGHICLSLLGTWSGPGWDPKVSTLLQVLLSIQSMILCEDPYYNEPGWAENRTVNDWRCELYSNRVRHGTLAIAILNYIRSPPPNFEDIAKAHFWLKKDEITAQVERWIKLNEKSAEILKTHRGAEMSFSETAVPIPITDIAKSIRRLCRIMKPPALPSAAAAPSASGAAAST